MFLRTARLIAALSLALFLAACTSTPEVQEPQPSDPSASTTATDNGAEISGADTGGVTRGSPLDDPESLLSTRIVYFEYDDFDVLESDRPIIEAHGAYLADNPDAAVTLEGHADERGSREYNIALGDARANSVRQLMTLLGASGAQVRTVSYGEERPAMEGHDEGAWSRNRRVEIIYRSR